MGSMLKGWRLVLVALPIMMLVSPLPALGQCDAVELVPSDTGAGDQFGVAVAVDGEWAVVGANRNNASLSNDGAAFVFRLVGGVWVADQKLTDIAPGSNYHFGQAVAISGNVIAVGVPDDDDVQNSAGSVQVFRHDGNQWNFEQELTAADPASGDRFGWSVALELELLAIGAKSDDDSQSNSGSVYVFRGTHGAWFQEQKLTAADPAANAQLGDALAIDGDTIVAGAWQDDDDGFFSGAAYVFRFAATTWTEEAKLKATDGVAFQFFGRSVAIDGDEAVVGAYGDGTAGSDAGAAYAFQRVGTVWAQQQKLVASDAAANDRGGWSVGLSGDTLLVGAHQHDEPQSASGAVYLFRRSGGTWREEAELNPTDTVGGAEFGYSLATSDERILVGAWKEDIVAISGSAYIYGLGGVCEVGTPLCFGDGSGTPCPCGNDSPDAGEGCLHTGGVGMTIEGSGSASIAQDDLTATARGCPHGNSGIFYSGRTSLDPGNVLFDGLQCAGGDVRRYQGRFQTNGTVSDTSFVAQDPSGIYFVPGVTYYFQFWTRDVAAGASPCGTAANFSPGLHVVMEP